jgi:hypothetical protein
MSVYTPEQQHGQRTKALRDFTREELEDYAWHSFCLWGTKNHEQAARFWLPRLADEFCFDKNPTGPGMFDIGWIARQIVQAKWKNWPEEEQQAIQKWFRALWDCSLSYPISGESPWTPYANDVPFSRDICNILLAFAQLEFNVQDFLQDWRARGDLPAIRQLVLFIRFSLFEAFETGHLDLWHYDDVLRQEYNVSPSIEEQVFEWLLSKETFMLLRNARRNCEDAVANCHIGAAYGLLRALATSWHSIAEGNVWPSWVNKIGRTFQEGFLIG